MSGWRGKTRGPDHPPAPAGGADGALFGCPHLRQRSHARARFAGFFGGATPSRGTWSRPSVPGRRPVPLRRRRRAVALLEDRLVVVARRAS